MFTSKWQKILNKSTNLIIRREISTNKVLYKNYYDALGLTPKATQTDIKAAYYKLSMLYHPDRNKGSEMAAEKFRDLSKAYEILGNFRLRKLYDKGIIHTAGREYSEAATHEVNIEDDPQTRFYKARMKRSDAPTPTGRTPIYDFDEWSRNHYGGTFERRQEGKKKFQKKDAQRRMDEDSLQKDFMLFGLVIAVIGFMVMSTDMAAHDTVVEKVKKDS